MRPPRFDLMTIDEALAYGRAQLTHSPTPHLDARILLARVRGQPYSYLLAHGEETLSAGQWAAYRQMVARARQGEPIPYITGQAPFFDFVLQLNPAVLIPRPETEELVTQIVQYGQTFSAPRIVDVGTGSGCIAIALARQLPQAHLEAVDISAPALAVARANARRLAPGRIRFYQGDLLQPISTAPDIIAANLPYISEREWTRLDDRVKLHEPALALRGGAGGLDLIRRLLQQASDKLRPGGALFLEIGWQQGETAARLARAHFPGAAVQCLPDLAGRDRILCVKT